MVRLIIGGIILILLVSKSLELGQAADDDDILHTDGELSQSVVIGESGDEQHDNNAIEEVAEVQEEEAEHDAHLELPQLEPEDDSDVAPSLDDFLDVEGPEQGERVALSDNALDRGERAAFALGTTLWPRGVLFYKYDETTGINPTPIEAVFDYIEQRTCIRFVLDEEGVKESMGFDDTHEGIVTFGDWDGCWSGVGFWNSKNQKLSPCGNHHGVVVHEIFHALGSDHEQLRSDKPSMYQVNFASLDPGQWGEYFFTHASNNTIPYSLDSVMQYSVYGGSLDDNLTGVTYDADLRYLAYADVGLASYKDWQNVNYMYGCAAQECPDFDLVCQNQGYVAFVNDAECKCICPPGLGGPTCEEVYNPEPISSWPEGSYCLAAEVTECAGTPFSIGCREEHFKWVGLEGENQYFPKGVLDVIDNTFIHKWCCGENLPDSYTWPKGTYCIYKYNQCPAGFAEGSVKFDDVNENNYNDIGDGPVPDGVYDNDTMFYVCCRDDGDLNYPMKMQNQLPFVLLPGRYHGQCQEVEGTMVKRMYHRGETELTNDEFIQPHPHLPMVWNKPKFGYCHYTPLKYDCGEVIQLSESNSAVTISSPNYPSNYDSNTICSWNIKSPENTIMKVEFSHFNITVYSNGDCKYDFLEIMHFSSTSTGIRYCGVQFPRGVLTYENQFTMQLQTSDFAAATGFEATVTYIEKSSLQYNGPMTYMGQVSYTQGYQKCLRWDEVTQCGYNIYTDVSGTLGPHNYCRDPTSNFERPWCYISDNCYTDICDVEGTVDCYDKSETCAQTIADNDAYCTTDDGFEHCHKTCGFCGQDITPSVDCGAAPPNPELGSVISETKDNYVVGDIITYKEDYTEYTVNRVCRSDGTWSGRDDLFSTAACPFGWVEGRSGRCYKYISDQALYPRHALPVCQSYGGYLATAPTEEDQKVIISLLPPNISEYHIGLRRKNDVFEWLDGSPLTYTNWAEGYPSDKDCVKMKWDGDAYRWVSDTCWWGERTFVCERPYNCDDGFTTKGDKCFRYHDEEVTYDDAVAGCQNEGAYLATAETVEKDKLVQSFIPQPGNWEVRTYLGMRRIFSDPLTYRWNNGQDMTYNNFVSNSGTGLCVAYQWANNQYYWQDFSCSSTYQYVCEKDPECPSGYRKSAATGLCYKLFDNEVDYSASSDSCGSEGGQLAKASTAEEQMAIVAALPILGGVEARFGLQKSGDAWLWAADGSALDESSYENWADYDDCHVVGDDANCAVNSFVDGVYQWRVDNCGTNRPFVCEVSGVTQQTTCEDVAGKCDMYASDQSKCTDAMYQMYALNNCRSTCGFCDWV